MRNEVLNYIKSNWHTVIRECKRDDIELVGLPYEKGTLVSLPYKFTIPAANYFESLYYWDTYFTNVGLILDGNAELAKSNVDNMLYLVNKYGYMPNSNATCHLDHSQPPFLSIMVNDIYEHFGDKVWLSSAYTELCREYDFWMSKRGTPIGLNRYDTNITDKDALAERTPYFEIRTQMKVKADPVSVGRHYIAICESGHDCNSRFDIETYNFAPVCLNSLMYAFEVNMAHFSGILEKGEESVWQKRAEERKALMYKYMVDNDGLFRDYNFVTGKKSQDFSAASAYPLFAGLADEKCASSFVKNLGRLETDFGILSNEQNEHEGTYQWGAPNGWAPHQFIAIKGLDRCGYKKDATRIANKYCTLVEKAFEKTHHIWEKYNVINGDVDVVGEDEVMPVMLGWTAGVYVYAADFIEQAK